ncbi:MAG: hypothetical protein M3067_06980 [Chloroflexota bacterium]|nr:hypothetical protein [Chloroflexota bacterium]
MPRKTGEMTEATAALETTAAEKSRTLLAQANRLGARYHPTWPLAILLIPLIAVATVSSVLQVAALSALIGAGGEFIANTALNEEAVRMSAISTGSFLLGVAVWSVGISVVIGNVPALVARWPRYGWISSLLGVWIPFVNLKRPFAVVREVCSQLSERPNGAVLVAAAWWLCILLWIFGSNFVTIGRVLGRSDATRLQSALVGEQFGLIFFVPAGIFAIGVVISIERLQRQALHRRETTVLMADGAAPA